MLTSITPLGERGRGHRWAVTSLWLLIGHLVGSAVLGAVLAAAAWASGSLLDIDQSTATLVVAVAIGLAVLFDAVGWSLPGRRQVDERWLTAYRGWVYGFGFGLQLGTGVVTVINTALLLALIVSTLLLSPAQAFAAAIVYGSVRGLGTLAGARVRSVGDLRALHMRLDRSDTKVRWSSLGIVAVAAAGTVGAVAFG